jgi:hypothetical protein
VNKRDLKTAVAGTKLVIFTVISIMVTATLASIMGNVGFGDRVALERDGIGQAIRHRHPEGAAVMQDRGRRRHRPEARAVTRIGPLDARHGDLPAPRAEATRRRHAQQPVPPVEGLQRQAGTKAEGSEVGHGVARHRQADQAGLCVLRDRSAAA